MRILITGSSGLIGSEAVVWLDAQGYAVLGVDNNMRREFFGPKGDTSWMLTRLHYRTRLLTHMPADIRDRSTMLDLFEKWRPDLIIHCAAQPSHDLAEHQPGSLEQDLVLSRANLSLDNLDGQGFLLPTD